VLVVVVVVVVVDDDDCLFVFDRFGPPGCGKVSLLAIFLGCKSVELIIVDRHWWHVELR
jgi:ABC-type uncharacterized transport system YnjBCD ATPase subunit